MKSFINYAALFPILLYSYLIIAWVVNLIQLFNCDFEPSYKDEIIHGIGLVFAPLSGITVWF